MEAIKRVGEEMKKHRTIIDEIQKQLKHEKQKFKRRVEMINSDSDGENDALNYGLIYAHADVICRHIKSIKELQDLINLKSKLIV